MTVDRTPSRRRCRRNPTGRDRSTETHRLGGGHVARTDRDMVSTIEVVVDLPSLLPIGDPELAAVERLLGRALDDLLGE